MADNNDDTKTINIERQASGTREVRYGGFFQDVARMWFQGLSILFWVTLAAVMLMAVLYAWARDAEAWISDGSPDWVAEHPAMTVLFWLVTGIVALVSFALIGRFTDYADTITERIVMAVLFVGWIGFSALFDALVVWQIINRFLTVLATILAVALNFTAWHTAAGFIDEIRHPLYDDPNYQVAIENNRHTREMYLLKQDDTSDVAVLTRRLEDTLQETEITRRELGAERQKPTQLMIVARNHGQARALPENLRTIDSDTLQLLERFIQEGFPPAERGISRSAWVGNEAQAQHGNSLPRTAWERFTNLLTEFGYAERHGLGNGHAEIVPSTDVVRALAGFGFNVPPAPGDGPGTGWDTLGK